MNHDIYIFGSVVRGDVSSSSDVDVLVVTDVERAHAAYPPNWSVYHIDTIKQFYIDGRLFAWHLYFESKCIYSTKEKDVLKELGEPRPYVRAKEDIKELTYLLKQSLDALRNESSSEIFELGICHTAIRDIAMTGSWAMTGKPNFSRKSPLQIPLKVPLEPDLFEYMMNARHSSTRGVNVSTPDKKVITTILNAPLIEWAEQIGRQL